MVCVNKFIPDRKRTEYYIDNKEHIKQYREDNKETIREKKNKPFECDCGVKHTHSNRARHLKSIKHCQFINSLQ